MSRDLPSPTALRSFEAAARHESFKAAAAELKVTPTAISHQIKQLERQLGCRLFRRETRQVRLTELGQLLFSATNEAFDRIEAGVAQVRRRAGRATLTLGLGPILAAKWLTPRLPRFWQRCPEVDLRLHHSLRSLGFRASGIDLTIDWGDGRVPDATVERLLEIAYSPVLSPGLAGVGLADAAELARLPLLHQRDHSAWRAWLAAAGLDPAAAERGVVFEDAHVALQAALEGQGVALGVLPLIADELAAGRLIRPFALTTRPAEAYYLVLPAGRIDPDLARLRDWLLEEAAATAVP